MVDGVVSPNVNAGLSPCVAMLRVMDGLWWVTDIAAEIAPFSYKLGYNSAGEATKKKVNRGSVADHHYHLERWGPDDR
jgi:hypothetical protein